MEKTNLQEMWGTNLQDLFPHLGLLSDKGSDKALLVPLRAPEVQPNMFHSELEEEKGEGEETFADPLL